jgi:peptide/nickel transport system ATP-binding protein
MAVDRSNGNAVLKVEGLTTAYETRKGDVYAVRDVSFEVGRGEAFGIVGESGCGKSTVAFSIVNFLGRNGRVDDGSILFLGQELRGRSEEELRRLRGDRIAVVYQDPMAALNPTVRIGDQLSEVLVVHRGLSQDDAYDKCVAMLRRVYMPDPESVMDRYTHQLSGGQQQRVVIAMALLNEPALLIMDEPTTALDVTVEAAVLDLIDELRRDFDTAIMYITHDLGVIARVAERMAVMYAGEIVETGTNHDVFLRPSHPYTQGLMRCVPKLGVSKETSYLYPIRGRVPSPANLPTGCVFGPRCDYAQEKCRELHPELRQVSSGHNARCHFFEQIKAQEWCPADGLVPDLVVAEPAGVEIVGPALRLDGVRTYYKQQGKSVATLFGLGEARYVKAVDDVSLEVPHGCTIGIVGESGCGKSTLAKAIVGLEPLTEGEVEFSGFDISNPLSARDTKLIRELQMVFQNPDSTLNPSFSVGHQIGRRLRRFSTVPRNQVKDEVIRLLAAVRMGANYYDRLPRQLSGGEKQRVGVARAFASRPGLVLCDEPVSALDVSVQAAVLNLLLEIQQQFGTTLVFIAHDLSVVRFFSDYIAVMYLGKICEFGPAEAIYAPPYHPYTEALLSAVPIPDPTADQKRIRLSGAVPSALDPPEGCRFNTRCPRKLGAICETEEPPGRDAGDGHRIYCHIELDELRKMDAVVTVGGNGRGT